MNDNPHFCNWVNISTFFQPLISFSYFLSKSFCIKSIVIMGRFQYQVLYNFFIFVEVVEIIEGKVKP